MPHPNLLAESELSEGGPEGNCPSTDPDQAWLADHLRSKTVSGLCRDINLSLSRKSFSNVWYI